MFDTRLWACRGFLFSLTVLTVLAACGGSDTTSGDDQSNAAPGDQGLGSKKSDETIIREITTYAGTGSPKFGGDGGPATEAGFYQPTAVTLDDSGNVYVATDMRVRKIDAATGIITTIVGTGSNRSTGDGALATEATLAEPVSLALDSAGNIFIAESGSGRIRRVDAISGIITTVAGGGIGDPLNRIFGDGAPATEALIKLPTAVAVDGAGNLYIATDNRVRKVDVVTGVITTFAGIGERAVEGDGGLATNAGLAEPVGLALDSQGNLFIADRDNHRVRKVDASTHMISTVVGQGKFAARLGNIYSLGNTTDRPLNRESAQGAGYSGDDGPAIEARLSVPSSIAFGPEGDLFIADGGVHVRRVDSSSGVITTVASSETVSSTETGKVQIYTTVIGRIVSIVVNDLNEIFLADFKKSVVHKVSKSTSSP